MAGAGVPVPDRFRHLPARLPPPLGVTSLDVTDRKIIELTEDAWTVYRGLFRRNAVYLTAIFSTAFAFELAFDTASNRVWDSFNRGRQWKDIKHRYLAAAEEEDDE
ncbi:ubiquinol-cytochrome C reductase [Aspergillus heteromorphus CBS 117.55]|uniref:Complex III subunit 9 n=1 Tax=Aspergillus heteromorphus CBS 117.55 TaxID=1448321 RepID=A0A317VZ20_9EURO|nr:ubiquinol-cytochrome C reductase [Aspergillus heteromorphus CBS 117.55]PWY78207.1 ubiquinol-cytochrome C reductase [Aspergillus heteromorphus CBS 117.55]